MSIRNLPPRILFGPCGQLLTFPVVVQKEDDLPEPGRSLLQRKNIILVTEHEKLAVVTCIVESFGVSQTFDHDERTLLVVEFSHELRKGLDQRGLGREEFVQE